MTDLVERIETTRFLGSEFLLWLWFKAELFETNLELSDGSILALWFDSQLLLKGALDGQERVQFTGVEPSASPEAKLALRANKLPSRARICMRQNEQEFSFVFDAETFSFGSVKLPAVLDDEDNDPLEALKEGPKPKQQKPQKDVDEQLAERMQLLQQLDELWKQLYAEFLQLRTANEWDKKFLSALLDWAKGKPSLTPEGYRKLLQRAR